MKRVLCIILTIIMLSSLLVSCGEKVTKGEKIAYVGSSGLATGPHLHFELIRNGEYVNPEYYLGSI